MTISSTKLSEGDKLPLKKINLRISTYKGTSYKGDYSHLHTKLPFPYQYSVFNICLGNNHPQEMREMRL
jgi:hypothetical protein